MPTKKIEELDFDLVLGELSRRSLKHFIKTMWPTLEPTTPFIDGWVIDAYCDHLAHIKDIRNLLVNVPPGTSKSLVFTVLWFCWKWIHEPGSRFLYSSHSAKVAVRDSLKARALIDSKLYQKCYGEIFEITKTQDQKEHFSNNKTGYRQIVSCNANVTGLKANYCVIDDPHDGPETTGERAKTVKWFIDFFWNRVNNVAKDCRIIIGQRIAVDDLSGFILENYKSEFTHLCLPFDYQPSLVLPNKIGWNDPRKEENQPLWPERFPENAVSIERKRPENFSAQWNQNPRDIQNALFKPDLFRYVEETHRGYTCGEKFFATQDLFTVASVDMAASTTDRADYTAIIIADITKNCDIIIKHILREKLGGVKIVPAMQKLYEIYKPSCFYCEDILFQRVILDQAKASGLPVRAVHPTGTKLDRSTTFEYKLESGQIFWIKDKPWCAALEKELIEFPTGRYDDMVDSISHLCNEIVKRVRPGSMSVDMPAPQKSQEQIYKEAMLQGMFR